MTRAATRSLGCATRPPTGQSTTGRCSNILASELTGNEHGEASQVGPLLEQTLGPVALVTAERAYDGEPVCRAVAKPPPEPPVAVAMPPCSTALPRSDAGTTPRPRDQHIDMIQANDRNSLPKHVWRAQIVLLTAAGHGTAEIMRQAGVAKTAVWRGRRGSWPRASMACCATKRVRRGSRHWTPASLPARGGAYAQPAARPSHPPDGGRHGQADRHQRQFGAADMAQPRPATPPLASVQAVQRSMVC